MSYRFDLDSITAKIPAYSETPIARTPSAYEVAAEGQPDAIRAILARLDRDRVRTYTETDLKAVNAFAFGRKVRRVNSVLRDGQGARSATPAERRRGAFGTN